MVCAVRIAWVLATVEHWWVYVLLAVVLVLVLILPRRLAKRSSILDDPKQKRTAQQELRNSMDRLLVELQEIAREINATIDTKMIALNRLVEEADRRIETLKDLQGQGTRPLAPQPVTPARTEPQPRTPTGRPLGGEATKRQGLEREICRLADEGKTQLEIARITDTPRGEVELVLSLRKTAEGESPTGDGETS